MSYCDTLVWMQSASNGHMSNLLWRSRSLLHWLATMHPTKCVNPSPPPFPPTPIPLPLPIHSFPLPLPLLSLPLLSPLPSLYPFSSFPLPSLPLSSVLQGCADDLARYQNEQLSIIGPLGLFNGLLWVRDTNSTTQEGSNLSMLVSMVCVCVCLCVCVCVCVCVLCLFPECPRLTAHPVWCTC